MKCMKNGIAKFVDKCQNIPLVKVKNQRPTGMAQNIDYLKWKWKMINMDLIIGLPRPRRLHDSISVIVNKIKKSAHSLPIMTTYSTEDYDMLYIQEVVRLHGSSLHFFR